MVGGAGRGECAWNREENDLLVGPELGGVVFHRDAAGGYAFGFFGPWDIPIFVLLGRVAGFGVEVERVSTCTYMNETSEGKVSPTLRPDIVR